MSKLGFPWVKYSTAFLASAAMIYLVFLSKDSSGNLTCNCKHEVEQKELNIINLPKQDLTEQNVKDPEYLAKVIRDWYLVEPELEKNYSFGKIDPYLYGRLGQPSLIDMLYREKTGGFFIECGAWDGEAESNSLLMELVRHWNGLLIEPSKQNFVNLLKKHRKTFMLEMCLSMNNVYEKIEFLNMDNIGGIASITEDPLMRAMRGSGSQNPDLKTRVQCFPLYSVLLAIGNPVVDLFSLDIEGAEIGVLKSFPFDKTHVNMFLIEMFHYVGEKEKEIKDIFAKAGYIEGPEIFPNLEGRNNSVNPNYDLIFYKKGLDIETNLDCNKFMGGYQGRGYRWGDQLCVGPKENNPGIV